MGHDPMGTPVRHTVEQIRDSQSPFALEGQPARVIGALGHEAVSRILNGEVTASELGE